MLSGDNMIDNVIRLIKSNDKIKLTYLFNMIIKSNNVDQ